MKKKNSCRPHHVDDEETGEDFKWQPGSWQKTSDSPQGKRASECLKEGDAAKGSQRTHGENPTLRSSHAKNIHMHANLEDTTNHNPTLLRFRPVPWCPSHMKEFLV